MIGIKAVVMPSFDLEAYCQAIQEHRVTFLYMVPPIVLGLSKSPIVDKYDLSSVKMGLAGKWLMIESSNPRTYADLVSFSQVLHQLLMNSLMLFGTG